MLAKIRSEKRRVKGEQEGKPVAVGSMTVTPVARIEGVLRRGPQAKGVFEFGYLKIEPVRAVISDKTGQERIIAIADVHEDIRRKMTVGGALVAAVALAIMLVIKLK
jgi:hypothetical protein